MIGVKAAAGHIPRTSHWRLATHHTRYTTSTPNTDSSFMYLSRVQDSSSLPLTTVITRVAHFSSQAHCPSPHIHPLHYMLLLTLSVNALLYHYLLGDFNAPRSDPTGAMLALPRVRPQLKSCAKESVVLTIIIPEGIHTV